MKSEIENLVENPRGNKNFKNDERKNNFEVEKVGRINSVNCNHTNSIIHWNQKCSNAIHVDPNTTNLNQPIPDDLINP